MGPKYVEKGGHGCNGLPLVCLGNKRFQREVDRRFIGEAVDATKGAKGKDRKR